MKAYRSIAAMVLFIFGSIAMMAQDIIVTVNPVQQVLPPQVLLYVSDPGRYFNVSLTNTSDKEQQVYLGLQIQQVMPASDLAIATPPKRQPKAPFVIQPKSTYQLTTLEMKNMFDHIPSSEISCPHSLFEDYANGSFGLLPEGQYELRLTAYEWKEPQYATPVVLNNPMGGVAHFTVCYKAQAPQFLIPSVEVDGIAQVNPLGTLFTWTEPVIACAQNAMTFVYDFRVVELLKGQQPDVAMDHNPVVYQSKSLVAPIVSLPVNVITTNMKTDAVYLAQVTARSMATTPIDYVMLENNGKSTYRRFRIQPIGGEPDTTKSETPKEADDDLVIVDGTSSEDSLSIDSLYAFRNPVLKSPTFDDKLTARKVFVENDIEAKWDKVWHKGGEGEKPEDLQFSYELQLFNGKGVANRDSALTGEPIFTKTFKETDEQQHTIKWDDIKSKVSVGDYLVLRVQPHCLNATSVGYVGDKNIVDFAMQKHIAKTYFECSNMIELDNYEPTTRTAEDLKGAVVAIGEYQLTIDKISQGPKTGTWQGEGRVEWHPLGAKVMVCVKFDTLRINTDNIVCGGLCYSYADPAANNDAKVVEKLFSDWGIDNLIGDTGLPYAKQLQGAADKVRDALAKKLDIKKYYDYYKTGKGALDLLSKGEIDQLYLPVKLPDEVNKLADVCLQIATMKFAPTYATMDLIGEFTLPNTNYTDNDILIFGTPRLCISPERLLPESGTVALLGDFKVKDPESSFTFQFNAPDDPLKPTNGTYISWHDNKFEMLGIDVDMEVPRLVKDMDGVAQAGQRPVLNVRASFSSWEDWLVDNVTMDPFQVEDLPGWTFTAQDIVYDHSKNRNSSKMGGFPTVYKREKNPDLKGQNGNDGAWQGLFIKKVGVAFPKSLSVGKSGNGRLTIEATDLFIDPSGATLAVGVDKVFSGETGKLGGWKFSLDRAYVQFVQNDFNGCHFKGEVGVPLLTNARDEKALLAYHCEIRKQVRAQQPTGEMAYIFTLQQIDEEMNIDAFIAKAKFQKNLTYLAVQAEPNQAGAMQTQVEFLMGGNLRIGGSDAVEGWLKSKIKVDVDIPDVHFVGLRIANCEKLQSEYVAITKLQKGAETDKTKILKKLYEGKTISNTEKTFFFSTGAWSLASKEKKIGPFELKLLNYGINTEKDGKNIKLKMSIAGSVGLVKGIDISAMAGVTMLSTIKNLSDFSNLSVDFEEVKLDSCGVHTSFSGVTLNGKLVMEDNKTRGKGFAAELLVALPGDLFKLDTFGGYYKMTGNTEEERFTWGYLVVSLKSKTGIQIPPVQITGITGGFYFNCQSSSADPKNVSPQKGTIGIILGMSLGTVGTDEAMKGDFTLTVAYDRKYRRLTQFLFLGDIEVASGLVKSKVKLLYENTDQDQFFQLTITTEAGISTSDYKLLQAVNKLSKDPKDYTGEGNLNELQKAENDSNPNKAGGTAKAKNQEQKKTAALGQLTLTLDIKITTKEKGVKLKKTKWHVYLGEPDEEKRCKLTLIDFRSKVVTLVIGANGYICVGNELPGDGQLPPIPSKIAQFLDGSTKGAGVKSDGVAAANSARAQAVANFGGSVAGGVMFGAQVYGNLSLNLGLIYGNLDALAGFDVSLRKLSGAICMNTGGRPGFKNWYAQGQLYAYFAAELGLQINLGFYKKNLALVNAGIGGVLEIGTPSPTYFMGKVRAKVSLLGGLVKFNKRWDFECGNVCQLFQGNPLDNFILFDKCSLGDTIQSKGWDAENRISPYITTAPYITTNASLDEHFRVLDENEYQKIIQNYDGDVEQLKMEAERTFVFRANKYCTIYEYTDPSKYNATLWKIVRNAYYSMPLIYKTIYGDLEKKEVQAKFGNNYNRSLTIAFKGGNPDHHIMDLAQVRNFIRPGHCYRMEFNGCAFEIENGLEVDPVTMITEGKNAGKYTHKPWRQTMDYFFATGQETAFADTCDLEPLIAIAYPSYYNKLRDGVKDSDTDKYHDVYYNDAKNPTIALTKDISRTAYAKGKLYWRILNPAGRELSRSENAWVTTEGTCNMEPQHALRVDPWQNYILSLDYITYSRIDDNIGTDTLNIGRLHIRVLSTDRSWLNGKAPESGFCQSLAYEKPFLGTRLLSYRADDRILWSKGTPSDVLFATDMSIRYYDTKKDVPARYFDPFYYIGYLSNFAYIGGWRLNSDYLFDLDITTTQSCILNVPNGGSYEGALGPNNSQRIVDDHDKIRSLFLYDATQYVGGYGHWPLPDLNDPVYDYVLVTDPRTKPFSPYPDAMRIHRLWHPRTAVRNLYQTVHNFGANMQSRFISTVHSSWFYKDPKGYLHAWMKEHRGLYYTDRGFTQTSGMKEAVLAAPAYQLPIVVTPFARRRIGRIFDHLPANHQRDKADIQRYIAWSAISTSMFASYCCNDGNLDGRSCYFGKNHRLMSETADDPRYNAEAAASLIRSGLFSVYRVNTYNFNTGCYDVSTSLKNGTGMETMTVERPFCADAKVTKSTLGGYNASSVTSGKTNSVMAAGGGATGSNTSMFEAYLNAILAAKANMAATEVNAQEKHDEAHRTYKKLVKLHEEVIENGVKAFDSNDGGTPVSKARIAYNSFLQIYNQLCKLPAAVQNYINLLIAPMYETATTNFNYIARGSDIGNVVYINAVADYQECTYIQESLLHMQEEIRKLVLQADSLKVSAKHTYDKLSYATNRSYKAQADQCCVVAANALKEASVYHIYVRANWKGAARCDDKTNEAFKRLDPIVAKFLAKGPEAGFNEVRTTWESVKTEVNQCVRAATLTKSSAQKVKQSKNVVDSNAEKLMQYTVEGSKHHREMMGYKKRVDQFASQAKVCVTDAQFYADDSRETLENADKLLAQAQAQMDGIANSRRKLEATKVLVSSLQGMVRSGSIHASGLYTQRDKVMTAYMTLRKQMANRYEELTASVAMDQASGILRREEPVASNQGARGILHTTTELAAASITQRVGASTSSSARRTKSTSELTVQRTGTIAASSAKSGKTGLSRQEKATLQTSGGVTLSSGGVTLSSGGVTLSSGGVTLSPSGVTLSSGGGTLSIQVFSDWTDGELQTIGDERRTLNAPTDVSLTDACMALAQEVEAFVQLYAESEQMKANYDRLANQIEDSIRYFTTHVPSWSDLQSAIAALSRSNNQVIKEHTGYFTLSLTANRRVNMAVFKVNEAMATLATLTANPEQAVIAVESATKGEELIAEGKKIYDHLLNDESSPTTEGIGGGAQYKRLHEIGKEALEQVKRGEPYAVPGITVYTRLQKVRQEAEKYLNLKLKPQNDRIGGMLGSFDERDFIDRNDIQDKGEVSRLKAEILESDKKNDLGKLLGVKGGVSHNMIIGSKADSRMNLVQPKVPAAKSTGTIKVENISKTLMR